MTETATFVCSICGETSHDICVYCTKDTCANHRCMRCKRCSDCCECEVPLTASEPERSFIPPTLPDPLPPAQPEPLPQPDPEPLPHTDPSPMPGTDPQPETPGPMMVSEVAAEMSHDELVRSLPELFAPDRLQVTEPALPEASEEPDMNTPRPEAIDEIVESAETDDPQR